MSDINLVKQFDAIFDDIDADIIQEKAGKAAYDICKEYAKVIKGDAEMYIENPNDNAAKRYVNYFTARKHSDEDGIYGAYLWNRKYTLSHLIEKSHRLYPVGHTHNDYYFWKRESEKMDEAFLKEVNSIIDDALK